MAKKPKAPKAPRTEADITARMSRNAVPGEGHIPCSWMLVGEGPGHKEDRAGRPFVGPTGEFTMALFGGHNLWRDQFYITNVVKRRIMDANGKDDTPNQEEVDYFRADLVRELAQVQPDYIVAAGGIASRWFLPDTNLELHHGLARWSEVADRPVITCYHPASGLHDTDNMQSIYWDYEQAARFLRGNLSLHEPKPAITRILPTSEMPYTIPNGQDIGLDTEWRTNGDPWCCTVSLDDGTAYFIAPDDHFALKKVRLWLTDPEATFYIHNTMADMPPTRRMGIPFGDQLIWDGTRARVVDTMVLAYEQGRVHGQGLKALVYRLLKAQMDSYDDLVEPQRQLLAIEYLMQLAGHSWHKPEPIPRYNEETGKVTFGRPQGLNQRLKRLLSDWEERDGTDNPVNLVERWGNWDPEVRDEAEQIYGPMPDADLSHVDPVKAKHYACQDPDMTRRLGRLLWRRHEQRDLINITIIDHGQIPMVERMQANGMPVDPLAMDSLSTDMKRMQEEVAAELSDIVGWTINPKSSEQVATLLYEQLGLIPLKVTAKGKGATDKKSLQHLRKENPLVEMIFTNREYAKIDDGFIGNIMARATQEWDEAGPTEFWRTYYQLLITRVKTGRLAAKDFNVLAIPGRTPLGVRLRQCFRTREGRMLGTWDLNQIEMRVMADDSRDPLMMEIYNRDPKRYPKWLRDLHIETACRIFGGTPDESWTTDKKKKGWRTACKTTGFGILMGIEAQGLQDQMRLYGLDPAEWTEDRCAELKADWLGVYKGVDDYQHWRKQEARRLGYVTDMFQRHYPLPHIHCPLVWIAREAERQAHALPIQGAAQAIEKMCMARAYQEVMPEMQAMGYCEPIVQIHDELIWEFDAWLEEMLNEAMMEVLTTTVRLKVPIEAGYATGETWGDLEK